MHLRRPTKWANSSIRPSTASPGPKTLTKELVNAVVGTAIWALATVLIHPKHTTHCMRLLKRDWHE